MRDEKGGVITEVAIAVPFLILMFAGIIALGTYIRDYQGLNSIAYETLRYATALRGIETMVVNDDNADVATIQNKARERAFTLLERRGFDRELANVETCFSGSVTVDGVVVSQVDCMRNGDTAVNIVTVFISHPFQSPIGELYGVAAPGALNAFAVGPHIAG